jgi:hypothetical protein
MACAIVFLDFISLFPQVGIPWPSVAHHFAQAMLHKQTRTTQGFSMGFVAMSLLGSFCWLTYYAFRARSRDCAATGCSFCCLWVPVQ